MIGFIGVGNMAGAILSGAIKGGAVSEENVGLFDPDAAKCARFPKARVFDSARRLAENCETVVFSVKPQVLPAVLESLDGLNAEGKVFVSICAAVATSFITKALPGAHVVRAMPNTPMLYGKGVCALSSGEGVTESEFDSVRALFEAVGTVAVLPEEMQNAVIAVTGSSPAYLFALAEAMASSAEKSGFDYEESVRWIADVFEGAAVMLRESGLSPKELREMVCSPGGTTLEAIRVFAEAGFFDTVDRAMDACTRRAEELQKD